MQRIKFLSTVLTPVIFLIAALSGCRCEEDRREPSNLRRLTFQTEASKEQVSVCEFVEAKQVLNLVSDVEDTSGGCEEKSGEVKDVLEDAQSVVQVFRQVTERAESIHQSTNGVVKAIDKASSLLNAVPKIGPILQQIKRTLILFDNAIDSVASKYNKTKQIEYFLNKTCDVTEKVNEAASNTSKLAQKLHSTLEVPIFFSEKVACCGEEAIENINAMVPQEPLELISDAFDLCQTIYGLEFIPDIPAVSINFNAVDEVAKILKRIEDWVTSTMDAVMGQADYVKCCSGVGTVFMDIAEVFSDVTNLATCWTGPIVEGSIQEIIAAFSALLEGAFDDLNNKIDRVNAVTSKLNKKELMLPKLPKSMPRFEADKCDLRFKGGQFAAFDSHTLNLPQLDRLSIQTDRINIGEALKEECTGAFNALTSKESFDCCPAARVTVGIPPEGKANGSKCGWSRECASGRCDATGNGKKCAAKLGSCSACNENTDCQSSKCMNGRCANPSTGKLDNGCKCLSSSNCQSGRCDATGNGKKCAAKLGSCEECNENTDCQSSKCMNGRCANPSTGKLDNGCKCLSSSNCQSGRCDATGNGKKCFAKLGSCSACNENTDCQSSKCISGRCANPSSGKLDNGCKCFSSSNCHSGRCDKIGSTKQCAAKLGCGSRCNENSDCQSGKCRGLSRRKCKC